MRTTFRRHPRRRRFHRLQILAQPRLRDLPPVHLKPFPIVLHSGRDISADPVSRLLHDRGNIGEGGTLAVGAGDMYKLQPLLRVAQRGAQPAHGVQTHDAAKRTQLVHILHGFTVVHGFSPSLPDSAPQRKHGAARPHSLLRNV